MSYKPVHFVRSHSKNDDPADNRTQVKLIASTGKDKSSKIAVIKTAQANKDLKVGTIPAQVTFKGTLGEFHNFWHHCRNYNMSI